MEAPQPLHLGHMVNESFGIYMLIYIYETVQSTLILIYMTVDFQKEYSKVPTLVFAHVSFVLICIQKDFTAYVIFLYLI